MTVVSSSTIPHSQLNKGVSAHQVVAIDGTDDQCPFLVHHDIDVFPQSTHLHTYTHAHAHACTHTDAVTSRRLLKWNRLDRSKGTLVPRSTIPTCVFQYILHTVLRRWEDHKTFIPTMVLNKDYRHPRKFCIFRAKFVSLGPSIRLTLSPSIYPKKIAILLHRG